MRLLILGGTMFIGRAVAEAALARTWSVTTFNRGLSGADLGGVDAIHGDRHSQSDLARLTAAGPWDAIIDCSGYVPRNVHAVARTLEAYADRFVFVSTVSVYEGWPNVALSEDSRILECPVDAGPDFGPDDVEDGPTRYGRLKAGCENAVEDIFGHQRAAALRLGIVLGPGEYVGRLPWWLRRVNAGGRIIAPGQPGRPIQPIDARDVASFVLKAVEGHLDGALNVVAPVGATTFGAFLQACRDVTGSGAQFVWVPDETLLELKVRQWSELPLWRTMQGVWRIDASRARQHGLVCRPIEATVRDTWHWMVASGIQLVNERSAEIGLTPAREQAILAALD